MAGSTSAAGTALKLGLDLSRLLLDRVRKLLFDPHAVRVEHEATAAYLKTATAVAAPAPPRPETSLFPDVFSRFGEVTTPSGNVGYIRLKSFDPSSGDVNGVVREFGRILATLPQTGLILDVRGNGGGYINIGELILQMLTPRKITPEPFHFLATPLTLAMAACNGLQDWKETIVQGLESGASFSQGFPLTDPDMCNSIGQIYQGPVVLVTNALCYSTTDIFAAGFQDHQIGTVLGCDSSTGAGGANVWDYSRDVQSLDLKPKNPFVDLPRGVRMRVAARRCTRVGSRSGNPVEDYGVIPDDRYYLTKADVVDHNADLIAAAAKIIKGLPKQTIRLTPVATAPLQQFSVDVSNVDRFDISLNDRPVVSQDVTAASVTVTLPLAATAGSVLTANGYRKGKLVVSTRLGV